MLEGRVDKKVIGWLRYIASPGVITPILLLLMYDLCDIIILNDQSCVTKIQLASKNIAEYADIYMFAGL